MVSYTSLASETNYFYQKSFETIQARYFQLSEQKKIFTSILQPQLSSNSNSSTGTNSQTIACDNVKNYFLFSNISCTSETPISLLNVLFSGDRIFFSDTSPVLSEAQGKIVKFNECCDYQIITFGGLSGAPAFVKRKINSTKQPDRYEYFLFGIFNFNPQPRFLRIRKRLDSIKKLISLKKSTIINSLLHKKINPTYKTEYFIVDFISYEKSFLQGVFHKRSSIVNLFHVAEKILQVNEYLLIVKFKEMTYKRQLVDNNNPIRIEDLVKGSDLPHCKEDVKDETETEESRSKEEINSLQIKIEIEIDIEYYAFEIRKKILLTLKREIPELEALLGHRDKFAIARLLELLLQEIQPLECKSPVLHGMLFQALKSSFFNE